MTEKTNDSKLFKILPFVMLAIFVIMTFPHLFDGRLTYEDESHAWTVAKYTNIFQLIELMNVEGHFLVWYIVLMPFAKLNAPYPITMYILNWLFCFIALVLVWKKAPFNIPLKMFITFSAPFFSMYNYHARCYSAGIMFLFLAMCFYKQRLKHPYLYLLALVLAANTSLQACVGAGILGLFFLYDVLKNRREKKLLRIIFSVVFLNLTLFYFQFHNTQIPDYNTIKAIKAPPYLQKYLFLSETTYLEETLKYIGLWVTTVLFPISLYKSTKAFLFFTITALTTLGFFTFVYAPMMYHIAFVYVYMIVAYWIYQTEQDTKINLPMIVATLFSFSLMYLSEPMPEGHTPIVELLKQNEFLKEGRLFISTRPITLSVELPYLDPENVYLYDLQGRNISKFEGLMLYFNREAKIIKPDMIAESLDKNRKNYFIFNFDIPKDCLFGKKYKILTEKLDFSSESRPYALRLYRVKGVEKLNP